MPTSWEQMFNTGTAARADGETDQERRGGLLSRMRDSLSKSRRAMTQQLAAVMFDPADADVWERLEEALILADCGVAATVEVIERLESEAESGGLRSAEDLSDRLAAIVAELMTPRGDPRIDVSHRPAVVLMTGVNGTGKTTSIGKIAYHLREAGLTCVIGAGDTFRAAAGEQLEVWSQRAGADFVSSQSGADPAAVAFDSVAAAQSRGRDVAIIDTAGRLHTQDHLMDELRKIHRVIGQRLPGAPHEVLLTIDATTGQNGLQQARLFAQAVDVTGIGESLDDLRPFDPEAFARALFDGN
jgi:fused signal recognition particle receptor